MKTSRYELDPRGDVALILQFPNRQHFTWPNDDKLSPKPPQITLASKSWDDPNEVEKGISLTFSKKKKKKKKLNLISQFEHNAQPVAEPVPELEVAPGAQATTEQDGFIEVEPEQSRETLAEPEEPASEPAESGAALEDQNESGFPWFGYVEERDEMQIRVSSRHLSLASPVFSRMLEGPWKEGIDDGQSLRQVTTSEWDTEAFLILMDIIHGHNREVPKSISLEMLGKIAVLVDYYDCHEITDLFADLWITALEKNLPSSYGKESTIWLCISRVFSRAKIFNTMTQLTMRECQGPLHTMELPIPERVLITLEDNRIKAIEQIFKILYGLREKLLKGNDVCDFECSSIMLGALMKEMDGKGLGALRPKSPFLGWSVMKLKESISTFRSPRWCSSSSSYYDSYHNVHSCTLQSKIEPGVDEIVNTLQGLTLVDQL